jgi:hypothetical protein
MASIKLKRDHKTLGKAGEVVSVTFVEGRHLVQAGLGVAWDGDAETGHEIAVPPKAAPAGILLPEHATEQSKPQAPPFTPPATGVPPPGGVPGSEPPDDAGKKIRKP